MPFGYAAPPRWKWLPLLFPLVLGIAALVKSEPDASVLLRLVAALIITVLGILIGTAIDTRTAQRGDQARYA